MLSSELEALCMNGRTNTGPLYPAAAQIYSEIMNVGAWRSSRILLELTGPVIRRSIRRENVSTQIQMFPVAVCQRQMISTNFPHLSHEKAAAPTEEEKVYREVNERMEGDTLVLEASYRKPDANFEDVVNPHGACPICSRNLKITYKDVLILSQFVDSEGNLLPRDLTGVCAKQQLHLRECVERALAADLLPDHRPSHLRRPPEKDKGEPAFHRF